MTDPLQPDRLLRKRNSSLQKQLDVTLQILGEEYRQCKDRMYKEERDCGKFLQSLYETVPGLQNYGPPNTRAMSASAVLRERHYSSNVSENSDTCSAADTERRPHALHHRSHVKHSSVTSATTGSRPQQTQWNKNRTGRESGAKTTEKRSRSVGDRSGSGPFRRGSQGFGGKGVKDRPTNRPKTADPYKPKRLLSQDDRSEKPRTSFGFRKLSGPSFGKNAYSDHDRLVEEMVLKKFHSIFDPAVRKGTESTTTTPIATPATFHASPNISDDERSSSTDDTDDEDLDAVNGNVSEVTQDNGEREYSVNPKHHCRRVVWSASPQRRTASVSASDIDELENPSSQTSPALDSGNVKPRSNSLSLPRRGCRIGSFHGRSVLEYTPVDPKIRALALQWKLPDNSQLSHHSSDHKPPEESQENGTSKALHGHQSTNHHESQARSRLTHTTSRPPRVNKSKSDTSILKNQNPLANSRTDSSPHANRPPANNVTNRRHSAIASSPSRRLSESSAMLNPDQLVDKLMNAGRQPCDRLRRPKTAPNSRSELSHRLVPVSRKTIVGILSEIENQKASTRNIVSTSKELQQLVKKLVPREYLLDDDSD